MNKVFLLGRVGKDAVIKPTKTGTLCRFPLVTVEKWTNKDGEKKESKDWHNVIIWDKLAKSIGEYIVQGKPVLVEGRLKNKKIFDEEGKDTGRWIPQIVADRVLFDPFGKK